MKVEIVKIIDRGVAKDERLWLKVLQDTDMSFYVVFDTTYTSENTISNLQRHAYWFETLRVKSGDNVVLYTRKGKYNTKQNADGTTSHFLYWGLDRSIWNNTGDCAVVFEVNGWTTSQYE